MFATAFNVAVLSSAVMSIVGDKPHNRTLHYIFKPFTMLLLIGYIVLAGLPNNTFALAMFVGLLFSLMGDVFLMLPKDRFIEGLASFLVAHIAYIVAFYQLLDWQVTWWWALFLIGFAAVFYRLLQPNLGALKLPVIVYISVIITMVWMAGELFWQGSSYLSAALFIGAVVFASSDSVLAWNKFKKPFRGAQWAILLTYFGAQWLLSQAILLS